MLHVQDALLFEMKGRRLQRPVPLMLSAPRAEPFSMEGASIYTPAHVGRWTDWPGLPPHQGLEP